MPSLEEGLVRTACEAMACGLPVVLTPHCGANDFVRSADDGEVVPICKGKAIAEAVLKCWEHTRQTAPPERTELRRRLSFEAFGTDFLAQLSMKGLI